jgi:hypothetical protein
MTKGMSIGHESRDTGRRRHAAIVVGVFGVLAEIDLHPVDFAAELAGRLNIHPLRREIIATTTVVNGFQPSTAQDRRRPLTWQATRLAYASRRGIGMLL